MNTTPGIAKGTHGFRHSLYHAVRLSHRGSRIVKINHTHTSNQTVVNALGGDMMPNHKVKQIIFTFISGTPRQTTIRGNTARNRNNPSIGTTFLANFLHSHRCGCGIERDDQFFFSLNQWDGHLISRLHQSILPQLFQNFRRISIHQFPGISRDHFTLFRMSLYDCSASFPFRECP